MFERLFDSICEFFDDLIPDEFCLPCFLQGAAEGLLVGLATLAVIAAAPAWLAVGLTVGLLAYGVYNLYNLAENWSRLSDEEKSKALGNIAGGLLAGRFGPKTPINPSATLKVPGVQLLRTPEGAVVPVPATQQVVIPSVSANASGATVASAAMMTGSGGDGQPPPEGEEIKLKYKEDWTPEQRAQADQKVEHLNNIQDKRVVKNPQRSATSASSKYKKEGNTVPKDHDVDHMHDLQLGGADEVLNMNPLDKSVNRSLGSQIHHQIKNLPEGTRVGKISISD
ncbi:hypothetical protein [Cystobacter ferrugineus]|uniref:Uncharacterized protein n=1 Tax=Cystobacter ferrugineus TaxID=83449 RepID=A0A1L9BKR8_9BACT|nr:hypothetical protein [Cystobacter ferrugineus]OJH42805.1 hypothetical protein BON30_06430 [Cystobacter ferrugineus]